jgi:acetoin utilization protein AcuB
MKPPPSLKQAMTPFPYSIERSAPLAEARQVMDQHKVRHLPVTDGHELVGIVTDRDLRSALAVPMNRKIVSNLTVKDLYIADAYVVDLEEPIETVLLTMAERHIGSALVTRRGRLAGVFTAVDVCRTFGEYIQENFPRPDGDEAA